MNVTCTRCHGRFNEGDRVQYTGITVYHELPKPIDQFRYAVDKPYVVTNIRHLICNNESDK